ELVDRGMARGAHVADRDALERGARGGEQEIDAGRTESDHDDAGSVHPPAGTDVEVVGVFDGVQSGVASRHTRGCGSVGGITAIVLLPLWSVVAPQLPYSGLTHTFRSLRRSASTPAAADAKACLYCSPSVAGSHGRTRIRW